MKTHVCVDARLINQAGIGTLLRSSLIHMSQAEGYEVTLLCRANEQEMLKKYSSRLVVMQSDIYTGKEQLEYLKKIPAVDLFWSPHFNVPLFPIRAKKRMTTISDVYHLAHLSSLTLPQKVYAKLLYNAAFVLSDRVITLSEFSREEILKFASFRPKKLEILSPSFDFFPPPSPLTKGNYLLFVGNMKPHKNLLRLVKAYAQLQPKQPLYLVGKREGLRTADSQLFQEVEKDSFLKHNVHFTGYVSEERLKELYAGAYLFIFPSIYEGFGYPPLEAMACGCPVVAAKTAAIPEVCQDAVEYVDPLSVDAIAAGISRLLNDRARREELIQKGRELVEKKRGEKNRIMEVIDACCRGT
jgi:glycosyltransferase involved in cell wall biosynthesis